MMPNAKILEEKKALVASLVEKIKNSPAGVLVDYKGINVEDDTKLRKQLREAGVEYAVIKNTLIRFAAKGTAFEALVLTSWMRACTVPPLWQSPPPTTLSLRRRSWLTLLRPTRTSP